MLTYPEKKPYPIDTLYVLHIQNYRKEKGEPDIIKSMKKGFKPFSPMTCTRHVYIFQLSDEEQILSLQNIAKYIKSRTSVTELLNAEEAYSFLLRWG